MPSQYKLTYFDLTGIGEPIRMLLHYGGINFVDQRVTKDEWPALKSKAPLEQLPILEVDGKVLFQSVAIARFVASQVGLIGKTEMENWEIDAVVDTIIDLKTKIATWFYENNEAVKETHKETLDNETMPFLLGKLDSWAAKNGGHLAIGKLTWADIFFVAITDFSIYIYEKDFVVDYPNLLTWADIFFVAITDFSIYIYEKDFVVDYPNLLTWADIFFVAITDFSIYIYEKDFVVDYPNLVSVRENVTSIPKVKAWMEKRPKDNWF